MESSYLMLLYFSRKNKKKEIVKKKEMYVEDIYRSSSEVTVVTNPLPKYVR